MMGNASVKGRIIACDTHFSSEGMVAGAGETSASWNALWLIYRGCGH
jgi:hypothetical protein